MGMGGPQAKAAETPVPASGGAADKAAETTQAAADKATETPVLASGGGPQPKAADPDKDTAGVNVPHLRRYALIRSIGTVSGPPMKFRNPRAAPGPGRL